MSTTQEILDLLRDVCDAATDGPWEYVEDSNVMAGNRGVVESGIHDIASCLSGDYDFEHAEDNARFIALSRTALPALVEALERLNAYVGEPTADNSAYSIGVEDAQAEVDQIITDALAPLKDIK